jgi:hypothetical protein
MIVENKKYIAEVDVKSLAKGLATGVIVGGSLVSGMAAGAKALGIGRFAPQQPIVQPNVPTQPTTSQIKQQSPVNTQQANNTQQKVVQKAPQKINQKEKEFDFGSEHAKRLYGAIVSAEHRGVVGKDPYAYDPKIHVRNKVLTNSSAYGPGQLTASSVKKFVDQGKIPKSEFVTKFLEQGKKLLTHGKKHSTYGFGRMGDLGGEEHADSHKQLTVDFMKAKGKELGIDIHKPLSKDDLYRFTKHWNVGIGSKEEPKKWYVDTIHNFYNGK